MNTIDLFIDKLSKYKNNECQNPWHNENNKVNLRLYFNKYKDAKYILIGEAPGRKGCLQCGVPFCDDCTLEYLIGENSSKSKKSKETSAQRIYMAFKDVGFIAWNAFPFQPCDLKKNNRTPSQKELDLGKEYLKEFLNIFYNNNKIIIITGQKAYKSLSRCIELDNFNYHSILHPSTCADSKREKLGYSRGYQGWLNYIREEIKELQI